MRSLYIRIWLTVLAALTLFALASGWLFQRQVAAERERFEAQARSRAEAWADVLQRSLPPADAPVTEQAEGLRDLARRLQVPLALDDGQGLRIAASEQYLRRQEEAASGGAPRRGVPVVLSDGRTLWIPRGPFLRRPPPADLENLDRMGRRGPPGPPGPPDFDGMRGPPRGPWMGPLPWLPAWADGAGLAVLVVLVFVAVGAGAYPVVRRLTRRLEALKQGVQAFGDGDLHHRVEAHGHDEVAAVARSFNEAAARIEALLRSNQSLLANASHELRSPLARLKMAVSLLDGAPPEQARQLQTEIHTNIGELDALVEEILLSSRLDARRDAVQRDPVDLLGLVVEEAARVQADVDGRPVTVSGDERLLRRALRNLLENARRYGGERIDVAVSRAATRVEVAVCDRGPGVPVEFRDRIFEAFFRLPGHAERSGGVGLGLSLVRQIAEGHGGSVRCEPREGGGSRFVLSLPA